MINPGSGSADVDTDSDTYAEIHESSPQMEVNECYNNAETSSDRNIEEEQRAPRKQKCLVAISVLVAVMMTVLVVTCVCVITALVQIAALQSENNAVALFDNKLMVLRQNFSQSNLDIRQLLADIQCPSFIFSCSSLHRDCHSGYYLSRACCACVL